MIQSERSTEEKTETAEVLELANNNVSDSEIQNSVLARLIKEVEFETKNNTTAYNRLHNRHNRTR